MKKIFSIIQSLCSITIILLSLFESDPTKQTNMILYGICLILWQIADNQKNKTIL